MSAFPWEEVEKLLETRREELAKDVIRQNPKVTAAYIVANNIITTNNQMAIALVLLTGEVSKGSTTVFARILANTYSKEQLQHLAALSLNEPGAKFTL